MGELVGIVAVIIAILGGAFSVIIVPLGIGIIGSIFLPILLPLAYLAHKRELREWDEYRLEHFGPVSE